MRKGKTKRAQKQRERNRRKAARKQAELCKKPWSNSRLQWDSYAFRVLEALDTPTSLGVALRLIHGEHNQLAELSVAPEDYDDPDLFFRDYQAVELLRKFPKLAVTRNPTEVAMEKFIEAERHCEQTNRRFEGWSTGVFHLSGSVNRVFALARRKIADLLGDVPEYADLKFRFGPGASFGVRGETHPWNKVAPRTECAFPMLPILGYFCKEFPNWLSVDASQVSLCNGSELTFVPKTAVTERAICIEPVLNGLYQKGVGDWLRKRLRRWGVTLDDQSVNQKLAGVAYAEGLATVDLKAASDTIAYHLVLELLPIDWVEFLDVARCPSYFIEGKWYPFHKFSSMGNAYTFELETLIFTALVTATCAVEGVYYEPGHNMAVYGDDIIVPREAVPLLREVLDFAGFTTNVDKTHVDGAFFESCGKDYFRGFPVRPRYLRRDVTGIGCKYYVTNQVLAIASTLEALPQGVRGPRRSVDYCVDRLRDVHRWCVSRIPKRLRLLGPPRAVEPVSDPEDPWGSSQTDAYLEADFDVALPRRHRCFDGYMYTAVVEQPIAKAYPNVYSVRDRANAYYWAEVSTGGLPSWKYLNHSATRDKGWERFLVMLRGLDRPYGKGVTPNGRNYTVRNRTKAKAARCFHPSPWSETPCRWGDRSIALVQKGGVKAPLP